MLALCLPPTPSLHAHNNASVVVNLHQAELLGPVGTIGDAADGDVGIHLAVVVDKLHVVHAVPERGWMDRLSHNHALTSRHWGATNPVGNSSVRVFPLLFQTPRDWSPSHSPSLHPPVISREDDNVLNHAVLDVAEQPGVLPDSIGSALSYAV